MQDRDCVRFLKSVLPSLGLRWSGYRKVHRTLCKRLRRRLHELALDGLDAYRAHLAAHPDERERLDALCRIPISRFCRDREVFEALGAKVLAALAEDCVARGAARLAAWSCGCASGEEPYSLRILCKTKVQARWPKVALDILATDADPHMLARARRGCYRRGSLKEMPQGLIDRAFARQDGLFCVRPEFRVGIEFDRQDVRRRLPAGPFDLILCRNLVFTYFERSLQEALLERLFELLRPGGYLVIGRSEHLPAKRVDLRPWASDLPIYRRCTRSAAY